MNKGQRSSNRPTNWAQEPAVIVPILGTSRATYNRPAKAGLKVLLKNVREIEQGNQVIEVRGLSFMKGSLVKELGNISRKGLRNLRSSNNYFREVSSDGIL